MPVRLASIYPSAWRAIILLLTLEIAIVSILRYFTRLAEPPAPVVANAFATPFLAIHVAASVIALVLAPLQFMSAIRLRWPGAHRATGRIYLGACALGAPSGLILSFGTTSGPVAASGFAMSAVLWPAFTWLGWRAATDRRIPAHRDWMLRSYAVVANAITLRVLLPISMWAGIDFFTGYPVIAWLGLALNLTLAEWTIRRRGRGYASSFSGTAGSDSRARSGVARFSTSLRPWA